MGLLSEEEIKDKAVIYRKENKRPLSEFQKKMNAAAVQIALRDPSVLAARNMLLNAAREKVINIQVCITSICTVLSAKDVLDPMRLQKEAIYMYMIIIRKSW